MRSFMLSLPLLTLVACVDSPATDTIATTDSTGQSVTVSLGNREIVAESAGLEAKLAWTDTAMTLESAGITDELATTDALGHWQLHPENPAFAELGPMFAAAEDVALAEGVALPWRADRVVVDDVQSFAECHSGSTWVFGSSCYSCYNAVLSDQAFYGNSTRHSRSCDTGTVYTTCSMTYCY